VRYIRLPDCCRDVEKLRLTKESSVAKKPTDAAMAVQPATVLPNVASSPNARPLTGDVPMSLSAAVRGPWSGEDWLLTSMYQQHLREAAYRSDVRALWTAAMQHHHKQQHTGIYYMLFVYYEQHTQGIHT